MTPIDRLKRKAIGAKLDHRPLYVEDRDARTILNLIEERDRLRSVLQRAVDQYGKPGGPWNVPSEPGSWIADARAVLNLEIEQ